MFTAGFDSKEGLEKCQGVMLLLSSGCSRQKGICLRIPEVLAGHDFKVLLTVSNANMEGKAVISI